MNKDNLPNWPVQAVLGLFGLIALGMVVIYAWPLLPAAVALGVLVWKRDAVSGWWARGRGQKTTLVRMITVLAIGGTAGEPIWLAHFHHRPTTSNAASGESNSTPAPELGSPTVSIVPPAVVPDNAELDPTLSSSGAATYLMPAAVSVNDVEAWYRVQMPPNQNFQGLTWLQALPPSSVSDADWYWCSGPGETNDVSMGQNNQIGPDPGRAFVGIATEPDLIDNKCG